MAAIMQIIVCILLLIQCKSLHATETEAKEEPSEELVQSESKDGKLEIIKRIKKINDDGSYTIGYEADDGSFKIESRDVLGQIKGTYGFVDEEGQIKRVSYSTSNTSEIINKPEPTSVVQRIPTKSKTTSTRIPVSTQSTPTTTSNSVVQSIARRRLSVSTSTTTQKPNYSEIINVGSRTTNRPSTVTYTSAPPRVLVQGRPISSTVATQTHSAKSEGQLIRPEISTAKPTELPLFRRLALKQFEDDKPVTEDPEPETRGNILRRQLSQENTREYNAQEHLYNLQQSLGHDTTDVYSSSMTTGTPRPLFTTTNRPRIIAIPSPNPNTAQDTPRPTVRYPLNYQRNVLQDLERNSADYAEATTGQTVTVPSTPTPLSIVQIPANRGEPQEPLVAIKHPFQRGTVLVPLSQLRGRLVPADQVNEQQQQKQYNSQPEQYYRETQTRPNVVEIEQQQAVVRRLPPPFRPIPVQVDENGFIRETQQVQTPYAVPVPVMPVPKHANEIENDVDSIEPPVSTRDFQKLLQQLIVRQSRLEKISALTRYQDPYLLDQQQQQQRYRSVYAPEPYYVRREPNQPNGPIQLYPIKTGEDQQERMVPRQFYSDQKQIGRPQVFDTQYDQQSYRPNRRVARLLPSRAQQRSTTTEQELQEEYLPPDVREMLLLRMLQLAINPALPLDEDKFNLPTSTTHMKRAPVRNVEILGEEEAAEPRSRHDKIKRYRELETDY